VLAKLGDVLFKLDGAFAKFDRKVAKLRDMLTKLRDVLANLERGIANPSAPSPSKRPAGSSTSRDSANSIPEGDGRQGVAS
jgi:hypothetical protein